MKKLPLTHRGLLLLCFVLLAGYSFAKAPKPKYKTGAEVVKAMYKCWQGKWYPNFQFEQRAIFYEKGKVAKEEVWQEIYSKPGRLHIRFNGFETGNGVIFSQDSVYRFENNTLMGRMPQIHPLVLLSFDVYFYKPEQTITKLQQLSFDLNKMSEAEWQGRKAYIIGATDPTDGKSSQFWVDKERLYVVRVLTNNKGSVRDVEMNNYQLLENKWVATEIVFKTNGETTLREEYFNISFPESTQSNWFEPQHFSNTRWQ